MLTQFFRSAASIAAIRDNPGIPLLDAFSSHLTQWGYSQSQGNKHLRASAHLLLWLDHQMLPLNEINSTVISRFEAHLVNCRCRSFDRMPHDRTMRGLRAFKNFVTGHALCTTVNERDNSLFELWNPFCQWMRAHRGTSDRTLYDYYQYLYLFLQEIKDDLGKLNAVYLRQFIVALGGKKGHARAKAATSALRMFIRFLIASGKCPSDLDTAIPSLAYWRLSSLPRYIQPDEIERVLASTDLQTPSGKRDRAILLLMARLGLRAGDVLNLRFTDIDWHAATIAVSGKNKQQTLLPLTQEVGEAIANYLQHGRPLTHSDCVFVRAIAPFRAFRDTRAISDIAKLALRSSGVQVPAYGAAHILRHSAATSMLRQGATLQDISRILRHSSLASTQIYAKVDTHTLLELAQSWPEVQSC